MAPLNLLGDSPVEEESDVLSELSAMYSVAGYRGLVLCCPTSSPAVLSAQAARTDPLQSPTVRRPGVLLTGYAQNEKFSKFYPYFYEAERLHQLTRRAAYRVYFRFDANEVGWIWLRVQCFDSIGKLLWEEKANSLWSGAMTPSGCARAAVNRIQGKIKRHVGKPGLPLRDSLVVSPSKPQESVR